MLIIKLDAIGDYILFRNFLKEIREDEKFKNYQITLLGNVAWKDLFESFDQTYVDRVIWVERKKLLNNPKYLLQLLKNIRQSGFEIVFNPTYWRDYYVDSLVRVSNASRKIGSDAFGPYYSQRQKKYASKVYTETVSVPSSQHEFYKFQDFVQHLLKSPSKTVGTFFPDSTLQKGRMDEHFIVIAPGANAAFRQWRPEFYAEIANYILKSTTWKCKIVGSKEDTQLAQRIISQVPAVYINRVENLTGKLKLSELPSILGNAQISFCNDTGTLHLAIASHGKVVCISNGNHYGRFVPYPTSMGVNSIFVFPQKFEDSDFSEEQKMQETAWQSPYDINSILPEKVIPLLLERKWIS